MKILFGEDVTPNNIQKSAKLSSRSEHYFKTESGNEKEILDKKMSTKVFKKEVSSNKIHSVSPNKINSQVNFESSLNVTTGIDSSIPLSLINNGTLQNSNKITEHIHSENNHTINNTQSNRDSNSPRKGSVLEENKKTKDTFFMTNVNGEQFENIKTNKVLKNEITFKEDTKNLPTQIKPNPQSVEQSQQQHHSQLKLSTQGS